MTRSTALAPDAQLRALHKELEINIRLLARCHDPRARGQYEALVYVQTFLRTNEPLPPRKQAGQ